MRQHNWSPSQTHSIAVLMSSGGEHSKVPLLNVILHWIPGHYRHKLTDTARGGNLQWQKGLWNRFFRQALRPICNTISKGTCRFLWVSFKTHSWASFWSRLALNNEGPEDYFFNIEKKIYQHHRKTSSRRPQNIQIPILNQWVLKLFFTSKGIHHNCLDW